MQLFKSEEDYFRHAGDLIRTGKKEKVLSVFDWEGEQLRASLKKGDHPKADYFLAGLSAKLRHEKSNFYDNPDLYDFSRQWLLDHFDLVKEVAFGAQEAMGRRDSGFLLVKFARFAGWDDRVDLALFVYHTLRFCERYMFISEPGGGRRENAYVPRLAAIGAYRYGLKGLVADLVEREPLRSLHESLPAENRSLYPEIKELLGAPDPSTGQLAFLALSDFSSPFVAEIGNRRPELGAYLKERIASHLQDPEQVHIVGAEIGLYLDRIAHPADSTGQR